MVGGLLGVLMATTAAAQSPKMKVSLHDDRHQECCFWHSVMVQVHTPTKPRKLFFCFIRAWGKPSWKLATQVETAWGQATAKGDATFPKILARYEQDWYDSTMYYLDLPAPRDRSRSGWYWIGVSDGRGSRDVCDLVVPLLDQDCYPDDRYPPRLW
jgi:hypothetical protein